MIDTLMMNDMNKSPWLPGHIDYPFSSMNIPFLQQYFITFWTFYNQKLIHIKRLVWRKFWQNTAIVYLSLNFSWSSSSSSSASTTQQKIPGSVKKWKVPGNRTHILLGRPLNLFLCLKKEHIVIYRGEGKIPLQIASYKARPLVEIRFVSHQKATN